MTRVLLGVDVATRLGRIGLAAGRLHDDGSAHVDVALVGGGEAIPGPRTGPTPDMVERVSAWLADRCLPDRSVLVGLDAPLGWPAPLADALAGHAAGAPLPTPPDPDRLWRRATDQDVHRRLGKLPLEVGADRIARAAHAGLALAQRLRERAGRPLPHLLDRADDGIIETYPAATLTAWLGRRLPSYKGDAIEVRAALLDALLDVAPITLAPLAREAMLRHDDAFDAAVCVLAAADLAAGRCPPVPDALRAVAAREGWIHVRS